MRVLTSVLGLLYLVSQCASAVPRFRVYEALPRSDSPSSYLHELTTITLKGEAEDNVDFSATVPDLDKNSVFQGFVVTRHGIRGSYNFIITAEYTYIPQGFETHNTIEFELTGPVVEDSFIHEAWHTMAEDLVTFDDPEDAEEWGSSTIESLESIGKSADSAPIEGHGVAADAADSAPIESPETAEDPEIAELRKAEANAKTAGKTRPIKDWYYYYGTTWYSLEDAKAFRDSLPEPDKDITRKDGFKITKITFEEQVDLSLSGILGEAT